MICFLCEVGNTAGREEFLPLGGGVSWVAIAFIRGPSDCQPRFLFRQISLFDVVEPCRGEGKAAWGELRGERYKERLELVCSRARRSGARMEQATRCHNLENTRCEMPTVTLDQENGRNREGRRDQQTDRQFARPKVLSRRAGGQAETESRGGKGPVVCRWQVELAILSTCTCTSIARSCLGWDGPGTEVRISK